MNTRLHPKPQNKTVKSKYNGTPCQSPTSAQREASPLDFSSAPTKHRWSLQRGNMQKQTHNKKGKLTEEANINTLHSK